MVARGAISGRLRTARGGAGRRGFGYHLVMKIHRALSRRLGAGLLVAGVLGGCSTPPGVEVTNKTGQTLRVEYLGVKADGSTQVYSTGVFANNSNLHYKVEQEGTFGNQVRFSIPDAPLDDGSSVLLKLSEKSTRYYDLEYLSGRLYARELRKSRIDSGVKPDKKSK